MKNSEISWIDGVPEDWEVKRFKDVAICNAGFPAPSEEFLLSSDSEEGINFLRISDLSNNTEDILFTKDKVKQGTFTKKFKTGTIVFPKSGESIRTNVRAILNKDMYVVSHLACLYGKKNINNKFLFYFLKLDNFENLINQTALPALGLYDIKNNKIVLPNLNKQNKIVSYLDTETSKIDRKISILEQKFEKLEEYKQSIIFETVTKGLDSNVDMKVSGIEWIGEIPAHWDIFRLKDVVKYINLPKAKVNTNNYLEIGDVDIKTKTYNITNKDKLSVDTARLAPKGTLLISTVRPNRGGIVITKYKHPVSAAFCAIKNPSKFWFYFVQTRGFMNELIKMNMDATYPTCKDMDIIKQVVCVPTKTEQEKIADYLDSVCLKIDKKKEIIKKQIELLKEYKQTMIYEAVTGKMEIL